MRHLPRLGGIPGGLALLTGQTVRDEIADVGQILVLPVGLAVLVHNLKVLSFFFALLLVLASLVCAAIIFRFRGRLISALATTPLS